MKDYYSEQKVSNSSLSWFQKSPLYFKMMLDGDIKEESKSYFEKGQMIHMYILEPEEFDKNYTFFEYTTPSSKQQKDFCESYARLRKGTKEYKLLKAYKSSYSTKEKDDKIIDKANMLANTFSNYIKFIKIKPLYTQVLSMKTLELLNEIKSAVMEHNTARNLIFNEQHDVFGNNDRIYIKNEFPVYWEWEDLHCKSLLDRVIIDHDKKIVTMVDLKTTSHMSSFKEKALDYSYNRQLAYYWMALRWYFINELNLNIDDYERITYIVAVSSTSPVEIKVFEMSTESLANGLHEIIPMLEELSWHFEHDQWKHSRSYYEGNEIEII